MAAFKLGNIDKEPTPYVRNTDDIRTLLEAAKTMAKGPGVAEQIVPR